MIYLYPDKHKRPSQKYKLTILNENFLIGEQLTLRYFH
jgi:hypothetical protein